MPSALDGQDQLIGLRLVTLEGDVLLAVTTPDMLEREGCQLSWLETRPSTGCRPVRRVASLRLPFGKDAHDLARDLARVHPGLPIVMRRDDPERPGPARTWFPLASPIDKAQWVGELAWLY